MANSAAVRLGMRRVTWVRITVDGVDSHAEVHGIGHRLPRTLPVPLATASALVADGVPLLLRKAG